MLENSDESIEINHNPNFPYILIMTVCSCLVTFAFQSEYSLVECSFAN